MSAEPAVYWTFTFDCRTCGKTIQVTDGIEDKSQHPGCPDRPALVIEGCNASTGLVDRVEQSLADYDLLTTSTEETP